MTDEELVLLARQGDTGAFDELVLRHQAAVYRAALAALQVPEDDEDVAQEALARAWSTLKRFRGESSFKTWLLTIACTCDGAAARGRGHERSDARRASDAGTSECLAAPTAATGT